MQFSGHSGDAFFLALPHGNFSCWASIRIAVDGRICLFPLELRFTGWPCLFPLELRPTGWPMDLGGAVNPRPVYKRLRSGHLDCFWLNGAGYCWILLVKPSKTQTPKKQSSNIQQYPAISGNIQHSTGDARNLELRHWWLQSCGQHLRNRLLRRDGP